MVKLHLQEEVSPPEKGISRPNPSRHGQQLEDSTVLDSTVLDSSVLDSSPPLALPLKEALAPSQDEHLSPASLFEGFRIQSQLGQGGFGSVYAAHDEGLDRPVAIKIFTRSTDRHAAARFRDEGKLLARLNHPNIIQVFRVGTSHSGHLYLAMERFGTGSLREHWPLGTCPTLQETCQIMTQLFSALEAAHGLGVVHRDIKEANLLYDEQNKIIKLCDFGIARALNRLEDQAQTTREGAIIGTEHYIAPERYQGVSHDPRSDLYSAGVLFYRLLTGRRPLEREAGENIPFEVRLYRLFHEPLPTFEGLPRSLARICSRLLEVNPDDRYQDAKSARHDLEDALKQPETASAPEQVPQMIVPSLQQLSPPSPSAHSTTIPLEPHPLLPEKPTSTPSWVKLRTPRRLFLTALISFGVVLGGWWMSKNIFSAMNASPHVIHLGEPHHPVSPSGLSAPDPSSPAAPATSSTPDPLRGSVTGQPRLRSAQGNPISPSLPQESQRTSRKSSPTKTRRSKQPKRPTSPFVYQDETQP